MKYSKMFTKTIKDSKEFNSINATLLTKGGFIHQTMAGVYTFLPLGLRVLNKVENIVREEMDKIGVELVMPALSPFSLWEKTGRLDNVDVLMKTTGANQISKTKNTSEYILNCTQEELITPISLLYNRSYKDFPVAAYQIQSKFRNEARAKSGIMRGREFRMKDLYSFHVSEESLLDFYNNVAEPAYVRVFERVGLGEDTVIALASGGDFTKEFSKEFQTRCDAGEDTIFRVVSKDINYNKEVAPSQAPAHDWGSEQKEMEEVETIGVTGMDALVKHLNIPAQQCVKTLIYSGDSDRIIVVAVRGDYDVDEHKVRKVADTKSLELASQQVVKEVTNAEIGYAGIVGLPDSVELYVDDALENAVNFECGGNRTDYHNINVNWDRDVAKPEKFYDVKETKEGDLYPETGEEYEVFSAAEVGNIFPLNTKFSQAFDYMFADADGKQKLVYMGCYGIGTSRLVGVLVEKFHDEKGIVWPEQVAPYQVYLISMKGAEEKAEALYQELTDKGTEVLWDDRNCSPGQKFGDADLIGCPIRLVVSQRNGEQIEWKRRTEEESELISRGELRKRLVG